MGMAGYDMGVADMAMTGGSTINWLLIGVVVGSAVLGVVIGILLGRRTMKKRDI